MADQTHDSHAEPLIHVHVCASCGRIARREESDGTHDGAGLFPFSSCGYVGPSNYARRLTHAHLCSSCDKAYQRDDRGGMPDAAGVFRCTRGGHECPLNAVIMEADDPRLKG